MIQLLVHVWHEPDGERWEIPEAVYAATKFTKTGWPDKRVSSNSKFYEWLSAKRVEAHCERKLLESVRVQPH